MRERIRIRMNDYVGNRDHNKMYNRGENDQHPMHAITGLTEELERININNEVFRKYFDAASESVKTQMKELERDASKAIANIRAFGANAVDGINDAYSRSVEDLNTMVSSVLSDIQEERETTLSSIRDAMESNNESISTAVTESANSALVAEAWAVGTENDEPVEEDSMQYENNAAYYNDQCRAYYTAVKEMYDELINK